MCFLSFRLSKVTVSPSYPARKIFISFSDRPDNFERLHILSRGDSVVIEVPGAATSVLGAAVLSSLQDVITQGTERRERRSNARLIMFLMVGWLYKSTKKLTSISQEKKYHVFSFKSSSIQVKINDNTGKYKWSTGELYFTIRLSLSGSCATQASGIQKAPQCEVLRGLDLG